MAELGALERALISLARADVDFVVVGMFGVILQVRDPEDRLVTQDIDTLLAPTVGNLGKALRALAQEGFSFESGGEPFVDIDDEDALAAVIRSCTTLRGGIDEALAVDVMLPPMTGYSWDDVVSKAKRFKAHGVDFRVGALDMLLESKRRSGRPKDLRVLEWLDAVKKSRRKRKAPKK